jgi:AcrR family transcriptional regulator
MGLIQVEEHGELAYTGPYQQKGLLSLASGSNHSRQKQEVTDFADRNSARSRAQKTMADLFEATAQLLETGAPERLTTNHVAERAGYAIGTLYRYFPNKLALLRAMAAHEVGVQTAKVQADLAGLTSTVPVEAIVRIFVRAALHPFAGRHRVHAGVMRLLPTDIGLNIPNAKSQRLNDTLFSLPSSVPLDLADETMFTMINAVTGAIEGAVRSRPELIASRLFEDELVGLVLHFLDAAKRCDFTPAAPNR